MIGTDTGELSIELSGIESARLLFDWNGPEKGSSKPGKGSRREIGRGRAARGSQRSK
jgi:hypothetical protein